MKWFGRFLLASLLLVGCSAEIDNAPVRVKTDRNPPVKTITEFDPTGTIVLDIESLQSRHCQWDSSGNFQEILIPDPDLRLNGVYWRKVLANERGTVVFGSKLVSFPHSGLSIGPGVIKIDCAVQPKVTLEGRAVSTTERVFAKEKMRWATLGEKNEIKLQFVTGILDCPTGELGYYEFSIGSNSASAQRDEKVISNFLDVANFCAYRKDPFGGSNPRFNGHRFWDSDVWLYPTAALVNPFWSRHLPASRIAQASAAAENFRRWKANGYPVANEKRHVPIPELVALAKGIEPLMYPWEADINGHEASPSDTKYEHHITGDVALMLDRAIKLGGVDRAKAEKIIQGCASFYLHRLNRNPDGTYGLQNVVSPDEWHTVNNDLYTNAIADWTIRRAFGKKVWPRGQIRLPRRGNTFATFDNDTYDEYQQAAAILALFPLEVPEVETEAEKMYDFYRNKASIDGPAMSTAISAIVAARLGRRDDAYMDWLNSWQPYTQDPTAEFREKPVGGQSYFVTGAAASLSSFFYGFLGYRLHDEKPEGYDCVIPLETGAYLSISPCIPSVWESVTYRSLVGHRWIKVIAQTDSFRVEVDDKPFFNSKKPE